MEFGAKFCPSKSKMLVVTAVFISLSVFTLGMESRKCYWCGPLAEQVHRSLRAPPCGPAGNHVTACDPGLNHCAVVATSPLYAESRLCVKYYQDECYSQYCNTSKTWRMTCPCRGDLCNGPNTERENDAFAILAKLAAKAPNPRNKRSLISSPSFLSGRKYKIDINSTQSNITQNNNDEDDLHANKLSDQVDVEIVEIENITMDVIPTTDVSEKTETTHLIEDDAENGENTVQKTDHESVADIKDPTSTTTVENEGIENDDGMSMIIHEVKPSELPTAEALQQDPGSTDKSDEPRLTTTTAIVSTVTVPSHHDHNVNNMMMLPSSIAGKNNTATKMHFHILTPIISMILHDFI